MTTVLDADSQIFAEKINTTPGIVLVDFTAEWCGPCKMIAPVLEQLAAETKDLTVLKVDADACWELTGLYQVMSFPTLMFFVAGQPVHRLVGARGLGSLREELHRVREAITSVES